MTRHQFLPSPSLVGDDDDAGHGDGVVLATRNV
jgi:hypothetical protein